MRTTYFKLLSLILVMAMLAGMFPMEVLAEEYQNTISSTTDCSC